MSGLMSTDSKLQNSEVYRKMSAIYDNWERLVNAALLREKLRELSRLDSISTTFSSEFTWSFRESDLQGINWPNLGMSLSYKEIAEATNHFSDENLIKRGCSGDFFTGNFQQISTSRIFFPQVSASSTLVVKRIRFDQGSNYWKNLTSELKFYSRIDNSRSRCVTLVGHCLESEEEKFLIYKYLEKRDLTKSLFFKTSNGSLASLDWITRLKIAIGVAEGLSFMHHDCYPPLAHGDVQASSILLDHGFEVRLGSLSKVTAQDNDSGGLNLEVTCDDDVYCFGRVLLELITGNLSISSSSDATFKDWLETALANTNISDVDVNLKDWLETALANTNKPDVDVDLKEWLETALANTNLDVLDLVIKIVDPSLIIDADHMLEVCSMVIVARSCLNLDPSKRPPMRYILTALKDPLYVIREGHVTKLWSSSWRHNPLGL